MRHTNVQYSVSFKALSLRMNNRNCEIKKTRLVLAVKCTTVSYQHKSPHVEQLQQQQQRRKKKVVTLQQNREIGVVSSAKIEIEQRK